ncbi:MAG: tRNA (adenosine(37)-N6)-threonylcarbamoyltransferase complex ATPase subunit type 1 TsaE [Pyramidobacter sp.]|jgi:tRNA threonylcarbamoyladenosine biosynthesis protein TsaE
MLKLREAEDGSACFILENLDDTAELGRKIAASLQPGMTLLMEGTLGAGKTTLVREICRALGWKRTCSPSFALVNEYARARIPIAHADLYRLENADGRDFGFDDYLEDGWVLIVEWPEHLAECSFEEVWHCLMEAGNEKRTFSVRAEGQTAEAALTVLENLCR